LNRDKLLFWLSECTGDDIWSIQHCQQRGLPVDWITELRDVYESGFQSPSQRIYFAEKLVNQFEGVRDVDLACRIAAALGVNVAKIAAASLSRSDCVVKIKESLEED
jgi:hypothetical protein